MKTLFFLALVVTALCWLALRWRRSPCRMYGVVDAIIPAFNEELCIEGAAEALLRNPYFSHVIVVDDGSTDETPAILGRLAAKHSRLLVVHQQNTGKGGALMAGVARTSAPYVFLTDADTLLPSDGDGIGHMLAEMMRGADAVGGVPSSNLTGAGILPHIRASIKLPMIVLRRTFQQVFGGAPFVISGSCGLFRTEVLRKVRFSDRTKVEDLDLTWTLIGEGYRVRQTPRCIVYPQECNSLKAEWLRWRRWIVGYAVCMRLHRHLLFSRFGIFSILPMFLGAVIGLAGYIATISPRLLQGEPAVVPLLLFPVLWLIAVSILGLISAVHHGRFWLAPLAPAALFYVFLSYGIWLTHGLWGLATGREPQRDKPKRYAHVVG